MSEKRKKYSKQFKLDTIAATETGERNPKKSAGDLLKGHEMKYRYIEKNQHRSAVASQCQALGVSRSGYYAWQVRQKNPKDDGLHALIEHIRCIHSKSRRTYGSPRVCAELRANGIVCNHKRVERLMRQQGLFGRLRRHKVK